MTTMEINKSPIHIITDLVCDRSLFLVKCSILYYSIAIHHFAYVYRSVKEMVKKDTIFN